MAQIGIHGMVGLAVRKWVPERTWLMLGIVLGSLVPDLDNLAVAVATITRHSTEGLHRTLTHSLVFVLFILIIFYLISKATSSKLWQNLGLGLGLGVLMHILLDLLIWFNGVELFWPFPAWINMWTNSTPPEIWMKLMDPAEMLCLTLFYFMLDVTARKRKTDMEYLRTLRVWMGIEAVLFVVLTILAFTLGKIYYTINGAVYLFSIVLSICIIIRMRKTIEAA
jgi:membrane-bound metal-dependent hydrolase YbcI (DUF457 family)